MYLIKAKRDGCRVTVWFFADNKMKLINFLNWTPTFSSSLMVTPPKKSSSKSNHKVKNFVDVRSVKKQLFPQPLPQGKLQAAAPPSPKKNYQDQRKRMISGQGCSQFENIVAFSTSCIFKVVFHSL